MPGDRNARNLVFGTIEETEKKEINGKLRMAGRHRRLDPVGHLTSIAHNTGQTVMEESYTKDIGHIRKTLPRILMMMMMRMIVIIKIFL